MDANNLFCIIICVLLILVIVSLSISIIIDYTSEEVHNHLKVNDKYVEKYSKQQTSVVSTGNGIIPVTTSGSGTDYIILTDNGEYEVNSNDYNLIKVNDTIDYITTKSGHYKKVVIL